MSTWTKKLSIFGSAGIVYFIGQYFRGVWFENLPINPCEFGRDAQGVFCNSPYVDTGLTFIATGEILAITGIVLLFANERGMRAWWRMSRWYVPIATLVVIFLAPAPIFPVVAPISREHITLFLGFFYILTTLIVVLRTRFISRSN